jgi:chromate transporter
VCPEQLFVAVLIANMIGFGGLSSLPVLRGQLLAAGLQADALLLQSLAVSNITPGPNGLYVVVVGYFVGGLRGAAIATLAILLPPLLVLPLERIRSRLIHLRRFRAAMYTLSLSVVALLALSSGSLVVHASTDTVGTLMAPLGAALLLLRAPPLVGVVIALAAGVLIGP